VDEIEIPSLDSIQLAQFKPQDKRKVLEKFLQDETARNFIKSVVQQRQRDQENISIHMNRSSAGPSRP
jgi:hypothetical protein